MIDRLYTTGLIPYLLKWEKYTFFKLRTWLIAYVVFTCTNLKEKSIRLYCILEDLFSKTFNATIISEEI